MKLTSEQIETIKTFISKRGFDYIDLQMEIISQISSKIEVEMEKNLQLTLDDAVKKVHGSLGVFGFGSFEDEAQQSLQKKYAEIYWLKFLEPIKNNFLVTLAVLTSCFFLVKYFNLQFVIVFVSLYLFAVVYGAYRNWRLYRKKNLKKFMGYRTASFFVYGVSAFLLQFVLRMIDWATKDYIVSANIDCLLISLIMLIAILFYYAGFKTHQQGLKDTQELIDKFDIKFN